MGKIQMLSQEEVYYVRDYLTNNEFDILSTVQIGLMKIMVEKEIDLDDLDSKDMQKEMLKQPDLIKSMSKAYNQIIQSIIISPKDVDVGELDIKFVTLLKAHIGKLSQNLVPVSPEPKELTPEEKKALIQTQ